MFLVTHYLDDEHIILQFIYIYNCINNNMYNNNNDNNNYM